MALDCARAQALEELRQWLYSRVGHWVARVYLSDGGNVRRQVPWPEDPAEREFAWGRLEAALTGSQLSGQVRISRPGHPRGQVIVVPWPQADLFAEADPAPPRAAETVTTGPDGKEVVREESPPEVPPPGGVPQLPGLEVKVVTLPPRPDKSNSDCADFLLQLFGETQRRFTTSELLDTLSLRLPRPWSRRVVEATLSWLMGRHEVDNERDTHGRGYGLTDWRRFCQDD